jgi:hypothetical protein
MSKHETDKDGKALPEPIAITPEQLQQVAAGVAANLSNSGTSTSTTGVYPPRPR